MHHTITLLRAAQLTATYESSLYAYDGVQLQRRAQILIEPSSFGLTVRYAVKANPHPAIIVFLTPQSYNTFPSAKEVMI
jgi:diaminopimelate decarboxylase